MARLVLCGTDMKTATLSLLSLSFVTTFAIGCNNHPLEEAEMHHWGDEDDTAGESGDESGSLDSGDGEEGGSSDDGGESNDGDVPTDCGGDSIEYLGTPAASVMLVIDKSGSMVNSTWDHDADGGTGEVTRWNSLHGVVSDLLALYGERMAIGAALFPAIDADNEGGDFDSACAMADAAEVGVAADNADAILAAIPAADAEVRGGTPTRRGITNALDGLVDIESRGARAMILVTDGAANCVPGADPFHSQYDTELPDVVRSAHENEGIPTYVVGIDIRDEADPNTGRNVRTDINEVAEAGGVPRAGEDKFYNATNQLELEAALDTIAAKVECTFTLDTVPPDPDQVEIVIDGEVVPRVGDCSEGQGWRFTDAGAPWDTIELCAGTCEAFRTAGRLDAEYGCPAVG